MLLILGTTPTFLSQGTPKGQETLHNVIMSSAIQRFPDKQMEHWNQKDSLGYNICLKTNKKTPISNNQRPLFVAPILSIMKLKYALIWDLHCKKRVLAYLSINNDVNKHDQSLISAVFQNSFLQTRRGEERNGSLTFKRGKNKGFFSSVSIA